MKRLRVGLLWKAVAAGIAPILGGKFADFFSGRHLECTLKYTSVAKEFSLPNLSLQQWDFFFFFAFIIGLYSLHRLTLVREVGEVEEKVVAQELVAEVANQVRILSSIEGLRQMVSFPFSNILDLTRKKSKIHTDSHPVGTRR